MEQFLKTIPKPGRVISRTITPDEPFLDFAGRFADRPGTVLLAGGGPSDAAGYHLLALHPWLTVTAKNGLVTAQTDTRTATFSMPPLKAVKQILSRFHINDPKLSVPVAAGLFGYLAYDLKDNLEILPRTCVDDMGLPDMYLTAPRLILVHDNLSGETKATRVQRMSRRTCSRSLGRRAGDGSGPLCFPPVTKPPRYGEKNDKECRFFQVSIGSHQGKLELLERRWMAAMNGSGPGRAVPDGIDFR